MQRAGPLARKCVVGGQEMGEGNKCARYAHLGGLGACSPRRIINLGHSEMVSGAI